MTICLIGLSFGIYLIFHPYTIECRLETGKVVNVRYYLGDDSKILTGLHNGDSVDLIRLDDYNLEYALVAGHASNGSMARNPRWVTRARVTKVPSFWDR